MDHTYVEENQIADRYVMGTLPAEEAERFENHYLSCPECLDSLELTESVERGFKRMAGQDAAQVATVQQLAVVAWLARLGRQRQLGVLLSALVVLAVIPGGVAIRSTAQLAQDRSTLEQVRQSSADVGPLREELAREREARAHAEGLLSQAFQPHGNDRIVSLGVERGESTGEGPAVPPSANGWVFMEVPVDSPFQPSYRAVLRDSQGKEISQIGDLLRSGRDTLSISVPAKLLPPGVYSVTIEPGGQRFNFHVSPPG
jgi:hypothetical protein